MEGWSHSSARKWKCGTGLIRQSDISEESFFPILQPPAALHSVLRAEVWCVPTDGCGRSGEKSSIQLFLVSKTFLIFGNLIYRKSGRPGSWPSISTSSLVHKLYLSFWPGGLIRNSLPWRPFIFYNLQTFISNKFYHLSFANSLTIWHFSVGLTR